MTYRLAFTSEAADQITSLFRYIAQQASDEIADRYVAAIIGYRAGQPLPRHVRA